MKLARGFTLKIIEDGKFTYSYAHENNTLLDRSQVVCTKGDLAKLKRFVNKSQVIDLSIRERMSTKLRFYKLINLAVFADFFKHTPLGCKDPVLSELRIIKGKINYRTYRNIQENHVTITCAFFVCLFSICTAPNDWKKIFIIFHFAHQNNGWT